MDSLQTLKLSNIENLHNSIDTISRTGIEQKGELVKDLNRKKELLINSIQSELKQCRQAERSLASKWSNQYNTEAYSKLEEYNLFIKQQHDRGSELIGSINAAKNFQQLNQVEMTLYNPFINELQTKCSIYAKHTSFSAPLVTGTPIVRTVPTDVTTEIQSTGIGKTDINVHHGALGTDVDINKEATLGSPAHSVHVSGAKGQVKVTHQPSAPVLPGPILPGPIPSPQPVRALSTVPVMAVAPVKIARPVVPIPVTPVQPIRPVQTVVPVQRVVPVAVSPVKVVPIQPTVRPAVPVQPVQTVPVRYVQPVITRPVVVTPTIPAAPVRVPRVRALVTHTHIPHDRNGDKIAVEAGTTVIVEKYYGDWALVDTPTGERGYVSRHYLRQL